MIQSKNGVFASGEALRALKDENKALKAENKELVETVCGMEKTIGRAEKVLGERNLLATEVERLKDALNEIRTIGDCTEMIEDVVARGMMRKIAFDALYGKTISRLLGTYTDAPAKESEVESE